MSKNCPMHYSPTQAVMYFILIQNSAPLQQTLITLISPLEAKTPPYKYSCKTEQRGSPQNRNTQHSRKLPNQNRPAKTTRKTQGKIAQYSNNITNLQLFFSNQNRDLTASTHKHIKTKPIITAQYQN